MQTLNCSLFRKWREISTYKFRLSNLDCCIYVCMYVFNFFRDAILISYTAGFHEGRLFSYLQVYKNEEKTN
jgi:hypothetical protein